MAADTLPPANSHRQAEVGSEIQAVEDVSPEVEASVLSSDADLSLPTNVPVEMRSDTAVAHLPAVDFTPEPVATLSEDAAQQYAGEVFEALNRQGLFWMADPDSDRLFAILPTLASADARAVEAAYANAENNSGHRSLRDDLKAVLSPEQWRKAEAILNRTDGRTNDAGNLMVSLTAISNNPDDGERRVLETFSTLNSISMAQLEADFTLHYNMSVDEALKTFGVSPDAMPVINVLRTPVDQRTAQDLEGLAQYAVEKKNLDYLALALRGDTPQAQEARAALQSNPDFLQKLTVAFQSADLGFGGTLARVGMDMTPIGGAFAFQDLLNAVDAKDDNINLMIAMDLVREGRQSLSTIALNNTGSLFGWLDNAENIETAVNGATEVERANFALGKEIAGANRQPASDEERAALEFYNRTQTAFAGVGDQRQRAEIEAKLLFGNESVVTAIMSGEDANARFSALEDMSQEEWKRLSESATGPQVRSEIERLLGQFASDEERARFMQILDNKAAAGSFETSQKEKRSISEVLEHSTQSGWFSTSYDNQTIADSVAAMTAAEAQRYSTDAMYKAELDNFIAENLEESTQQYLQALLKQVESTGKPPQIGETETALAQAMNVEEGEKTLSFYMQAAAGQKQQGLLASGEISAEEKHLIDTIAAQSGQMQLEDKMRAFVLSDGIDCSELKKELQELSPDALGRLRERFISKYGTALEDDFLSRVDAKDRAEYARLLTTGSNDGRQAFYDNLEAGLKSESGITPDGSEITLERAINNQGCLLQDFSARFEELPKDVQDQANQLFCEALQDYKDSKAQFAEKLYQAAVLVGGITVAVATGGVAIPALLAVAALSAAGRVALMKGIQGEDYELSLGNILKDGAVGALTGAFSVMGPETIMALKGLGTATASALMASGNAAVRQSLREGAEVIIAKEVNTLAGQAMINGQPIAKEAIEALARKIVADGADVSAVIPALQASLTQAGLKVNEQVAKSMLAGLSATSRELGSWAAFGGATNVLLEGGVSLSNGEFDINALPDAFITGAVFGGGIAGAFKSVSLAKPLMGSFRRASHDAPVNAENLATGMTTGSPFGEAQYAAGQDQFVRANGLQEKPGPWEIKLADGTIYKRAGTDGTIERIQEINADDLALPPTTGKAMDMGDGITSQNWADGTIVTDDRQGLIYVIDEANQITRTYKMAFDASPPPNFDKPMTAEQIDEAFPQYLNNQQGQFEAARALESTIGSKGQTVNFKLEDSVLDPWQKNRILLILGYARDHLARKTVTVDGVSLPDPQQVRLWEQTVGEVGRVLDAVKRLGLTGHETEDAVIASIFSNAMKTDGNFPSSHIEGSEAAKMVLRRADVALMDPFVAPQQRSAVVPQDRVRDIANAIRETQITPPAAVSDSFATVLRPQTASEKLAADNITRYLADPYSAPSIPTPVGRSIDFSPVELNLLTNRLGVDDWSIPGDSSQHIRLSDTILRAKADEQLRSPAGFMRALEERGLSTDASLDETLEWIRTQASSDLRLLDGRVRNGIDQLGERDPYIARLAKEVDAAVALSAKTEEQIAFAKLEVEDWLRSRLNIDADAPLPAVPYFNSPLPPRTDATEAQWLFANEIRLHMLSELSTLTYSQAPRNFVPVLRRADGSDMVAPKVLSAPTGANFVRPVEHFDTPVQEYVKINPVIMEDLTLADLHLDASGKYTYVNPDTGVLREASPSVHVKVYKPNGMWYAARRDAFMATHAPAPGRPDEFIKTDTIQAQQLDRRIIAPNGEGIPEVYNPGDYVVLNNGKPYYVKEADFESLYAVNSERSFTVEKFKKPSGTSEYLTLPDGTGFQTWQNPDSTGHIEYRYKPGGGVDTITVTDQTNNLVQVYRGNKLFEETYEEANRLYYRRYFHEHAQEVKDLPNISDAVAVLTNDPLYKRIAALVEQDRLRLEALAIPAEVIAKQNRSRAERIFAELFQEPYPNATNIRAVRVETPYTWKMPNGEEVQAYRGDMQIYKPDGSLATVIESQYFEQAYRQVGDHYEFIAPRKGRRFDAFVGLTGAGKTTSIKPVVEEHGIRILEADDVKVGLDGYHIPVSAEEFGPALAERNGLGAVNVRERSNQINDILIEMAMENDYSFGVPGVLAGDVNWHLNKLYEAKAKNYENHVHFIEIPKTVSAQRTRHRFLEDLNNEVPTGARFVNPSFMISLGDMPRRNFDKLVDLLFREGNILDSYEHIWNYEKRMVLESGTRKPV